MQTHIIKKLKWKGTSFCCHGLFLYNTTITQTYPVSNKGKFVKREYDHLGSRKITQTQEKKIEMKRNLFFSMDFAYYTILLKHKFTQFILTVTITAQIKITSDREWKGHLSKWRWEIKSTD